MPYCHSASAAGTWYSSTLSAATYTGAAAAANDTGILVRTLIL